MVDQVGNSEELPRRKFIKQCVVAGVTLYTAPLVLSLNEAVAQASNSGKALGYKAPTLIDQHKLSVVFETGCNGWPALHGNPRQ